MDDWNVRKARLREKFAKLNERDSFNPVQEELIIRLQKRLGATREAIQKLLSEL